MANQKVLIHSLQVEDILNQFSEEEVVCLATTITGGLLRNKITSRQDAVKAVINYSEDVPSILRRKLITREKLLSYLYEKNEPVKLPITKPEIIKKILNLWNVTIKSEHSEDGSSLGEDLSNEAELDDSSLDVHESNNDLTEIEKNEHIVETYETNDIVRQVSSTSNLNSVIILAEQFSLWFYKLLNDNELTSEHFFLDASMNLSIMSNGETNSNSISNDPIEITKSLFATRMRYDLFFNPNLSKESLKGQMDPHGLVMLIVCGTLHSKSICVGVFEQMFALARDPSAENNWKIKRTDVILKSNNNYCAPKNLSYNNVNNSSDSITE